MIKAEQIHVTNLRTVPLTWDNAYVSSICTADLGSLEDRIGKIDDRVVTLSGNTYKPLICICCGAPINRELMTCEYCGVQYGKGE